MRVVGLHVQGQGRIGKLALQTPAMINFGENTEDEVFISHEAATAGVEIENTGSDRSLAFATSARLPSEPTAERRLMSA